MYFQLTFPVRYVFKHGNVHEACVIPELDPFDPSIMKFVWDPAPLICDTIPALVFVDESGFVQFNKSSIPYYGGELDKLKCEYRVCFRHTDDDHVSFSQAFPLEPPAYIVSDFFSVTCQTREGNVVFERLLTNVAFNSTTLSNTVQQESEERLSVVLFGIDSVSRSCAIRKLPKTFKYLTKILGAYDFKGHMKVGENTLPNLVPLFTGLRVWTPEIPITDYARESYDIVPFIWNNFSQAGYATMLAEDMPDISTFNYLTKGFNHQPTDHYLRTFYLGLSEMEKIRSKLGYVFRFLENRNINLQKSSSMCYHDKPHHVIQTDYLRKFIHTYRGKRKFAVSFLTEIAHEYPNFLSYGDEDFLQFLQWMNNQGHLNTTVLVFFSDHGARIDKIRNTFVGRIEARMPLTIIHIPDHIKRKFPNLDMNMQQNTKRLSTNFDLYQTMVDIMQSNYQSPTISYVDNKLRGISLFRALPKSRSCADAWIPESHCGCYSSSVVNISTNHIVKNAAAAMVHNLNFRLKSETLCAQLELLAIQEAYQITQGLEHSYTENTGISLLQFSQPEQGPPDQRYFVVIETVPGHAIFESYYVYGNKNGGRLLGEVIRVNKYGDQGHCISDKRLRPLCYCT